MYEESKKEELDVDNISLKDELDVNNISLKEENKESDLIEYPLKINHVPFYTKIDSSRYEFRVLDSVDSKRIQAHKRRKNTTLFVHLKIEDSKCQMIQTFTNIFEFTNSCDFYLDQTNSTILYNRLTKNILSGSLNDLISTSQEIKELIENNTIPDYTPLTLNISTTVKDSINLKSTPSIPQEECFYKITYDDEVPTKCSKDLTKSIGKYIQEDLEVLKAFFSSLKYPIMRITYIDKHLKEFNKLNNGNLNLEKVKKALPLFRYYYIDGPWRKSWVEYGLNPKDDVSNYKYQIVDIRSDRVFFTLIEKENIIKEVEEHKEWYLKEECDKKHGYFKKTLEQLILYHNYVEFSSSEHEDIDFEVFDV